MSPVLNDAYHAYLRTDVWNEKRRITWKRARARCQVCGARRRLDVHHNTYERFGGDEWPSDLILLCRTCHDLFHEAKRLAEIPAQLLEQPQPQPPKRKRTIDDLVRKDEDLVRLIERECKATERPKKDPDPNVVHVEVGKRRRRQKKQQGDAHLRAPFRGATRR